MTTYEELQQIPRSKSWRTLRGMRAFPPGAASSGEHCKNRATTFNAALEQAEQMFTAAATVGPQTRPLLLFYGLSQAGRAIAAAATRLSAAKAGPQEWKLRGHGITADSATANRSLADVMIRPEGVGSTSFAGVAKALGSPTVGTDGVRLGDLYATLPEAKLMQLEPDPEFPALIANIQPLGAPPTTNGYFSAVLSFVSARLMAGQDSHEQRALVTEFLGHYPSLSGWQFNPAAGELPVVTESVPGFVNLTVYWPFSMSPAAPIADQIAMPYRGRVNYVFPAVSGNAQPLHPLLAWWGVLHALSVVARYEPEGWFRAIDIDRQGHQTANAVEHLLDAALDAVPELVVMAINQAAT